MEILTLRLMYVVMFISSGLPSAHGVPVPGFHIKSGNFQMLQKHPLLLKCAQSVLQENTYFGCRVSELTGECQGLTRSWGLNPTTEQGYAYAKKVFVEEHFQPPPLTLTSDWFVWEIPVVLGTGARIDISMSIPNWTDKLKEAFFNLELTTGPWGPARLLHRCLFQLMATHFEIKEITYGPEPTPNLLGKFESTDRLPAPFSSKEIFTISLLAQPDSLAIFVDDKELTTFKLSTHIKIMTKMTMQRSIPWIDPISIHSIKFTGKID